MDQRTEDFKGYNQEDNFRLPVNNDRRQEKSLQLNPTQIQGTITEDTPVALRTRSGRQQTVPISTNDGKGDSFKLHIKNETRTKN